MAIEFFSWPNLHERMCRTWGSNSGPLACQADTLPIELPRPAYFDPREKFKYIEHIGKPENMDRNFSLSESSRPSSGHVLHKNVCSGYSLESPHWVPTTYVFMQKCGKLFLNYHQIPSSFLLKKTSLSQDPNMRLTKRFWCLLTGRLTNHFLRTIILCLQMIIPGPNIKNLVCCLQTLWPTHYFYPTHFFLVIYEKIFFCF